MKKIFSTFVLSIICIAAFSQIYTRRNTDKSITISPRGIESKTTNNNDTTNTALGSNALIANTTGFSNSAFGNNALNFNTTGNANSAFGKNALQNNTTATGNSAFGNAALNKNISGTFNNAFGSYSLEENTTGNSNNAFGYSALRYNTTSFGNNAFGYYALLNNTEGNNNCAFGQATLTTNTTGVYNNAFGYMALNSNDNGVNNTGIGSEALISNVSGSGNTALGKSSLYSNVDGTGNTAVGQQAGYQNISGSRNVFLGYQAGYNVNADDILIIENSNANRALIRGDFANDKIGINRLKTEVDARTETFQVEGEAFKTTGTGNWIIPSDRRLKENILYLNSQESLNKVLKMKGVSYNWIDKSRGKDKVFGFIAQDLQQVFPENIKTDKEGFLSASYGTYDPMIIESIKALKQLIDEQRKMIDVLKNKVEILSAENKEKAKLSDK